jgi:hypothetical protein
MYNLFNRLSFRLLRNVTCAAGAIFATAELSFAGDWGAIAVDRKGNYGYAVGFPSATEARKAAVKGCGNSTCRNVMLKEANCVAMSEAKGANGAYWFWVAYGPDSASTTNNVETWCNDNGEAAQAGCEVVINNCK